MNASARLAKYLLDRSIRGAKISLRSFAYLALCASLCVANDIPGKQRAPEIGEIGLLSPEFRRAEGAAKRPLDTTNPTARIAVKAVSVMHDFTSQAYVGDEITFFSSSTVENNIVTPYTISGIVIGDADTSKSIDEQALAWSPFDNPFSDTPPMLGNPLVPVRNNCVWKASGSPATAFTGATWYDSGYDNVGRYKEVFADPYLDSSNGYRPLVSLTVGNPPQQYARQNYFSSSNPDPILGAGNPYRIDLLPGPNKIMRRSIGAYEVRRTALPVESYYHSMEP